MKLKLPIALTLMTLLVLCMPMKVNQKALALLPGDGSEIDDSSLFQFLQGKGGGDLREFLEGVSEGDIVPDRPEEYYPIQRGASEDKFFGDAQSLSDMELFYSPHFDLSPYNWVYPPWPDFPYGYGEEPQWTIPPDDPWVWYLYGCTISCFPGVIYCNNQRKYTECTIETAQAIGSIDVTGQVADWYLDGDILYIEPSKQAENKTYINIKVCTETKVSWQGKAGCCETSIPVDGCGCECITGIPFEIIADSTTEAAFGDICSGGATSGTFYVESDGLACPPYTWTLSAGDGSFNLNGQSTVFGDVTAETTADGEVVTVSKNGNCGSGTLTVTDDCGASDTYDIRCSDGGSWVTISSGCGACEMPGLVNTTAAGLWIRQIGYKKQEHWVNYTAGSACAPSPCCSTGFCAATNCSDLSGICAADCPGSPCLYTVIDIAVGGSCEDVTISAMENCYQCYDGNNTDRCTCYCTDHTGFDLGFRYSEWGCP